MKKRVWIISIIITFFFISSLAHAGSSSRKRIEGILIGSGVTVLGAAVIGMLAKNEPHARAPHRGDNKKYDRPRRFVDRRPPSFHKPPPPVYRHATEPEPVYVGYRTETPGEDRSWSSRRIWVDPVYDEVWVPGYYNKRDQWIEGYHETVIVEEGYWKTE